MNNHDNFLISVIIPVYKVEKYLSKCVESIINQTYKNLEIILVNDGSPDNCGEICDEYAKKDSRIKVIHKENGGLSDARNAGIEIASGQYIAFVDSDDYIASNMYERMYETILKDNSSMVVCGCICVREKGSVHQTVQRNNYKEGIYSSNEYLSLLYDDWTYVVAWNKLYKKSLFSSIRYPKGKIHEDEFAIHKIVFECEKISCIRDELYYYLQRDNSITGKINIKSLDCVEAYIQRYNFLKEKKHDGVAENALAVAKEFYNRLRIQTLCERKNNKKRIKEIDEIFYRAYSPYMLNLKEKIKYRFPGFWFVLSDIKGKNLYRIRIAEKLIKYRLSQIGKKSILVNTPEHGNLGDHAIVLATEQICRKNKKGKMYFELTGCEIEGKEKYYALLTPKNKNVIVNGGGYLGILWINEENKFKRILQSFKNNKIVVFPQTVTFDSETHDGLEFINESYNIYKSHKNLTVFVREEKSFNFMRQYMPDIKCTFVPDIVLQYRVELPRADRNGIGLCLRRDSEKVISEQDMDAVLELIEKKYPDKKVIYTDTVIDSNVKIKDRERIVKEKLTEFSQFELVITDRLHGMIFSAITNTPCIALDNINGKVGFVYEWIRECEFIKHVLSVEDINAALNEIDIQKEYMFDYKIIDEKFKPLEDVIKNI